MDHPLLLSSANPSQARWVLGLLSLYPQEVKRQSIEDQLKWSVAIAAPPWGEKTRDLLIDDPWLPPSPLDCPSAIRESEARRVFAAHQRCSGTTYALMSPGIGFRTSKDLEYFREELVKKNWLDAVVALPSGANAATSLEGLLLVLKQDREAGAPIQMISAHKLLNPNKTKSARQVWDPNGVKELAQLINDRSESFYARLIPAQELEANGFSFQVSRYLHSEDDLVLQRYLDSRATVQLGDLAEIRRPVASLGRQEDGIEVREVTPGDIDDSGQLLQGTKLIRLPEAALAKGRQHLLERGDVLLSIKGGLGKVSVVQDLEQPTVPGQAFCVVRLRPNAPLTPAALVQYLRSAVGQTLLNKAGQGAAVSFVPMGEVKGLPVVIPSSSELQRAESLEQESVTLSREVEALSRQLQQLSRQGWMEDLPPKLVNSGEELSS
jgi:type I restriction enzyme M protein